MTYFKYPFIISCIYKGNVTMSTFCFSNRFPLSYHLKRLRNSLDLVILSVYDLKNEKFILEDL